MSKKKEGEMDLPPSTARTPRRSIAVSRKESLASSPAGGGHRVGQVHAGMTMEQMTEFKKQQLVVGALSARVRDLEMKLEESNALIASNATQIKELSQETAQNIEDVYGAIEKKNIIQSDQFARIRIDVQKLANDQVKPLNYDPYNYGEAYDGDPVDFTARKRICELDASLKSVSKMMKELKDAMAINEKVDLGFKVVRLDELLKTSGFDKPSSPKQTEDGLSFPVHQQQRKQSRFNPSLSPFGQESPNVRRQSAHQIVQDSTPPQDHRASIAPGRRQSAIQMVYDRTPTPDRDRRNTIDTRQNPNEQRRASTSRRESGLLVTASSKRQPDRVILPKLEMFQTETEKTNWDSTDSIMQTVYRLEMEISELQKTIASAETTKTEKTLEEIKKSLNQMKDNKLDKQDLTSIMAKLRPSSERLGPKYSTDTRPSEAVLAGTWVSKDRFDNSFHFLKMTMEKMTKRLQEMESLFTQKGHPTGTRSWFLKSEAKYCMSCNRPVLETTTPDVGIDRPSQTSLVSKLKKIPQSNPYDKQQALPKMPDPKSRGSNTKQNILNEHRIPPMLIDETIYPSLCPGDKLTKSIKGLDGKIYAGDPGFNQQKYGREMSKKNYQKYKNNEYAKLKQSQQGHDQAHFPNIRGQKHWEFQGPRKLGESKQFGEPLVIAKSKEDGKLSAPREDSKVRISVPLLSGAMSPLTSMKEFEDIMAFTENLKVVYFYAEWCEACKNVDRELAEFISKPHHQGVAFYAVDVDYNVKTAQHNKVQQLPTFIIYSLNGEVARLVGSDLNKLEQAINEWNRRRVTREVINPPFINLESCSPAPPSPPLMEYEVAYEVEMEKRRNTMRDLTLREAKAATTIQAGMRGMMTRRQLKKEKEAATKIQAGMKGMKVRKELTEKKKEAAREEAAAIKIQAGMKGMMVRRDLLEKRLETESQRSKEEAAATKIQAGMKGMMVRKEFHKKSEGSKSSKEVKSSGQQSVTSSERSREEAAATKIQAGVKGMLVRKEFQKKSEGSEGSKFSKQEKSKGRAASVTFAAGAVDGRLEATVMSETESLTESERAREEQAALKIQAGMKGMMVRKELHKKQEDKGSK